DAQRLASERASRLAGLCASATSGPSVSLRALSTAAASRQAGTGSSIHPSARSRTVIVTHDENKAARGGEPPGSRAHGTPSRAHHAATVPPVGRAPRGSPHSPASRYSARVSSVSPEYEHSNASASRSTHAGHR